MQLGRGKNFGKVFDKLINQPRIKCLDRRPSNEISEESFMSCARASKPFIISGGNVVSFSTIERLFKDDFGGRVIKVRIGDYSKPELYGPDVRQYKDMSLSEYVDGLNSPVAAIPPYAGNQQLPEALISALNIGPPNFYPSNYYQPPSVWLGPKGSITPLHRDSGDNFAIHLYGKKRWTIFPPKDAPYLYFKHIENQGGGDFSVSQIDLGSVDNTIFPLYSNAVPITFEVSEGEILYLPMGWAHHVENLQSSLMINFWINPDVHLPEVLIEE